MHSVRDFGQSLRRSKFFKDSAWAVFGNGLGYGLLLIAGILIARFLGKDLYGEYGFIKTTMFQFAAFSTLGLGYTSTKYIAEYRAKDPSKIVGIARASLNITLFVSLLIALLLFVFASPLSIFLEAPSLKFPFQVLGIVLVLRALTTTQMGIMAGQGIFKSIAYVNFISGMLMLTLCIPLTYYLSLKGAFLALALSQLVCAALNHYCIHKANQSLPEQSPAAFVWTLTRFSIPVALQELTYALGRWLGVLMITKLSSLGEVGLFTASELWGSVILIIPSMLSNVMISHLSYSSNDPRQQAKSVRRMLAVNLVCTLSPLGALFILSPWVVSFYGPSFHGMTEVMLIITSSTVFTCCSNVLSSELIAQGRTWSLFIIRCTRDFLTILTGFLLLREHHGVHAAKDYAISTLACAAVFFLLLYIYYKVYIRTEKGGTE